jgi:protein-S-isoprenylcysteine O-methyltransferase Ste14
VLQKSLERQGEFLFQWRGFLPFLGLPVLAWELSRFTYPFGSRHFDVLVEVACFAIAAVGIAVRAGVQGYAPAGTSGRNTRRQKAALLNTTGMYSLCRNPLYFGNFLICFGVLLFFRSAYLLAMFTLLFCLYYERIILTEEAFLERRFGERFLAWAEHSPAFLPRFSAWRKPGVRFSWRLVLRREYTTVFTVVAILTCFEVLGDFAISNRLRIEPAWIAILLLGSLQYVVLRFLKKRTEVLRV